jgi:hypothetical protein
MEGVEKEMFVYKRYAQCPHNIPESISQVVIPYLDANLVQAEVVHNDVHKVTARNKWRCWEIETSVCMRYASALSAVHNMAESISSSNTCTLNQNRLRWYMHNDVHKVQLSNKWRVLRNWNFVCMRYAMRCAVHNMAESISQVILCLRR